MTKLNDKQIAAYEAKGFSRWTKGKFDRLYINAKDLGAEISYYGTGNVRSAKWHGERVSNADGRRLLASKVFVDVNTGELHVDTSFDAPYDTPELEDAARAIMAEVKAETAEPEIATEETTEETKPVWSDLQDAINAAHEAVRALTGYGICGSEPELGGKVDALNAELEAWVRGMEILAEQGAAHVDRASVMAASERRCEEIQNAIANGGGVFQAETESTTKGRTTMTEQYVTIDGTEFAVTDNDVRECGTLLHYDPETGRGYQLVDGRRIALTSYEAFGADMGFARKTAEYWMGKAKRAWLARA